LLADADALVEVAGSVSEAARRLMARFWPGAVTLILPRGRHVSPLITAGGDTVAIRIPDHPIPRSLIRQAGLPLIGTSANIFGSASPVTAQHVAFELGDQVDLILDGGRTRHGRESTVVDTTQDPPRVVRVGAVAPAAIEEALR
jgi:L-threonylcarbamoyladenylate synthase